MHSQIDTFVFLFAELHLLYCEKCRESIEDGDCRSLGNEYVPERDLESGERGREERVRENEERNKERN